MAMPGRVAVMAPGVNSPVRTVPLLNRTVLPSCSIERSPHGDLLDEQQGSAAGRIAQGGAGRTPHECARSAGSEVERPAVPAPQAARPGAGAGGLFHALRGRHGNRRLARRREQMACDDYDHTGFNDVHLREAARDPPPRRQSLLGRHIRLAPGGRPSAGGPRRRSRRPANRRSANSPNSTSARTRGSRTAAP